MSVFVKDIDVPSDCDGCWHPTCNLWLQTDVGKRHKDCPISPMPEKHGRLIDANAFKETLEYYIREAGWDEKTNQVLGCVKDEFIDSEPTIVEAEE